jgi:GAF domain-containing protein
MSIHDISPRNRVRALFLRIWDGISRPDASIHEPYLALRARLLAALSLLLFIANTIGIVFTALTLGPQQAFASSFLGLVVLGVISLLAYVFSRTPFIYAGSVVFTAGISLSAYLLAFATSGSISVALYSVLLPAFIISAALLSGRGILSMTLINTFAVSLLPIYLTSYTRAQAGADAFNLLTAGAMLWILIASREATERRRLADLQKANAELQILQTGLEQRVEERTNALAEANRQAQIRTGQMQSVAEISQTIALVQNPDDLLPLIAGLISERFGFYHVGIFLVDERREYAVLQAANSKGGQRMLARRHRLKLGATSMVGLVCQTGRARVASDVGADAVHFDNPDLPETHSEAALPLKVGEQIIGALDVQSAEIAAFKEEELDILITLANQAAIAIQNARLYSETRKALSEARKYSGVNLLLGTKTVTGYAYKPDGALEPVPAVQKDQLNNAVASGQTLIQDPAAGGPTPTIQVPVKLRDQIIGVLNIQSTEPNRRWSDEEIALAQTIAERAAFAVENARLFENANRRAEQEQAITHVTRQISASTDFNKILQTTIQELGRSLNATRAYIQLGTTGQSPEDDTHTEENHQ